MYDLRGELNTLKSLVRRFLHEIEYVPFRAVDCDQTAVEKLTCSLYDAIRPQRKQPAKKR